MRASRDAARIQECVRNTEQNPIATELLADLRQHYENAVDSMKKAEEDARKAEEERAARAAMAREK